MKIGLTGWILGLGSGAYLLATLGQGLAGAAAIAQETGCFMVTSSGQRVSLDKLCGVSGTSTQQGVHTARIKRREGGTPVIDVTFNGSRTFEMLLDTGASGTLITQQMAAALNVPVLTNGRFVMADGRTVILPIGRLRSISIDGAEARDLQVVIAPNAATGLLGQNFFGRYDIKIKQDVVEFHRR